MFGNRNTLALCVLVGLICTMPERAVPPPLLWVLFSPSEILTLSLGTHPSLSRHIRRPHLLNHWQFLNVSTEMFHCKDFQIRRPRELRQDQIYASSPHL